MSAAKRMKIFEVMLIKTRDVEIRLLRIFLAHYRFIIKLQYFRMLMQNSVRWQTGFSLKVFILISTFNYFRERLYQSNDNTLSTLDRFRLGKVGPPR